MKRFPVIMLIGLLLVGLLAAFSPQASAGDGTWSTNAIRTKFYETQGEIIRFTCTVDSVDTLSSAVFNLRNYDGGFWGPKMYAFKLTGHAADTAWFNNDQPFSYRLHTTSVKGAPKISAFIMGSFFPDTLFAVVDTLCTERTSETASISTIDFNNKKYPYYRLDVYGIALCRADAIFDFVLYAYQKEQ